MTFLSIEWTFFNSLRCLFLAEEKAPPLEKPLDYGVDMTSERSVPTPAATSAPPPILISPLITMVRSFGTSSRRSPLWWTLVHPFLLHIPPKVSHSDELFDLIAKSSKRFGSMPQVLMVSLVFLTVGVSRSGLLFYNGKKLYA